MGNILNPSPGDLADRQTILQIKIEHCGVESDTGLAPKSDELIVLSPEKSVLRTVITDKTEIDIQPFVVEHEGIQSKLQLDWFSKLTEAGGAKFDKLLEQLRGVNQRLWNLEDQARILREAPKTFVLGNAKAADVLFDI